MGRRYFGRRSGGGWASVRGFVRQRACVSISVASERGRRQHMEQRVGRRRLRAGHGLYRADKHADSDAGQHQLRNHGQEREHRSKWKPLPLHGDGRGGGCKNDRGRYADRDVTMA